ncbi:MAG: hypothetical protein IJV93_13145, partial [Lentisphaeria bacterium]|nr:hypothetical protein [Lentisphaeria bacterium]
GRSEKLQNNSYVKGYLKFRFLFSGKSRWLPSFPGAFCVCFGMAVVLFEQKNFLCVKKWAKQRYFRSLTKQ